MRRTVGVKVVVRQRKMDTPTTVHVFMTSLILTSCLAARVTITSPADDISMSPGQPLVMTCEVTDVTNTELSNGQLEWGHISSTINILTSDGTHYAFSNTTSNRKLTSTLTIVSVTFEDDGTYYCTWRYQGPERSDYATVTVTAGPPDIVELEVDRQPVAGRDVVITCTAQGKPFPTISWRGRGGASISQLGVKYDISTNSVSSFTTRSRLTLQGMTSQASGLFRCLTSNSQGSVEDSINVRLDPWTSIMDPIEGETNPPMTSPILTALTSVLLHCNAYNVPRDVTIEWSFRQEGTGLFVNLSNYPSVTVSPPSVTAVTSDAQFYIMTSEVRFRANFSTQGTVRCRSIDSNNRVATFDRDLHVEDLPQVTLTPDNAAVAIGDEVEVTCTVQARPYTTARYWAKDLVRVNSADHRVNAFTHELRIKFSIRSQADFGQTITCYGTNSYGTESVDFYIEDVDECITFGCPGNDEDCFNTVGSYRCECYQGYYRNSDGDCDLYNGSGVPTFYPGFTTFQSSATTTTKRITITTTTTTTQQNGASERNQGGGGGGGEVAVYAGVGAGVAVVIIIIVVIVFIVVRRRRRPLAEEMDIGPKAARTRPTNSQPTAPDTAMTYANAAFAPNLEGYTYTPLNTRDRSEFPRDRLHVLEKLGQGKFGMVSRAMALSIHTNGKWDTVAVKRLKEAATDSEKSEFFRELTLLRSLPRHQNVVTFVGCCTTEDPTLIIMEYCEKGDLLNFLRMRRPNKRVSLGNPSNDLTSRDLFSFALHVARGMAHVAKHKIVHRDVATRNVLLTDRNVCRVSDLGLSRRLDQDNDVYELVSRRPLPIRWMSPESLRDGVHTSQSDVWSYGVLLWELVTLGASPYPGKTGKAVIDLVVEGRQPDIPPQCTGQLASIMASCWHMSASRRPTFDVIAGQFERLLEQEGDYLSLDNLDEGIYSILEPSTSGERV